MIEIQTNDWEQRKLLGCIEKITDFRGRTPKKLGMDWSESGYLALSALNVKDGYIDFSQDVHYGDQALYEKWMNGNELHEGQVLFTTEAPMGNVAQVPDNKRYILSQRTIAFDVKEDIITENFLATLLRSPVVFNTLTSLSSGGTAKGVSQKSLAGVDVQIPVDLKEQTLLADYFQSLDHLITLHQCKCKRDYKALKFAWEQRKLSDCVEFLDTMRRPLKEGDREKGPYPYYGASGIVDYVSDYIFDEELVLLSEDGANITDRNYPVCFLASGKYWVNNHAHVLKTYRGNENNFICNSLERMDFTQYNSGMAMPKLNKDVCRNIPLFCPSFAEQKEIGDYFRNIDHLITLHQRKHIHLQIFQIYTETQRIIIKETNKMPELENVIEEKLIDQLVYGKSQWTYRADLKTEADLWNNFKYILEQNNKERLNGQSLSDAEFEQVKNQLQFSSFYKAGEWLVGENGKVMVHVQRGTEKLHLVVMNHEHIAGGSSVYEVINQYSALASDDKDITEVSRNRRFDVTLMINGLPMIHIELKNRQHSYMDAFWQIKKYISEGKFTGIFSAVQMFVVSNGVATKYFAAAGAAELNPKFMSDWVDKENNPVMDYLEFAKSVLRIPEAHEMIARYTVLDEDAKRLILLRPYQIHAIESIREASKTGTSGYVWHTTGSGKTLTSYKATRNLLMDIPAIDKTIFLIDRKDLDKQTTMAFQAYANNDLVDVDETDNVNDLKRKLKSGDRQVIVTTIQKLQILISKRLQEGTVEYSRIKNLKIAFVVDECHRAVTPKTKRELERFFGRSLWYGFTGTPRFAENPYPQLGDLPRTTEELYGKRLHQYTIQNAIRDRAVLGFQVEHNGPKNLVDETDSRIYDNEIHMLSVLDIILNKSYHKLGFQNGKGQTYEGILTTSSIQLAQKYYELLMKVKNGETSLKIDEKMKQVLPDFPKFAITYSVTETEEGSHVNQEKMQESLNDYNKMFGTRYEISQIQGYNANLNKRLARKDAKFKSRSEQLDLVIVVDRLLTGFDAPCMSAIFIDRQPMGLHDLIQAFSRTNRIFDKNKTYGQIVTFQAPKLFKETVERAVKLYSAGSTEEALVSEWEEIEPAFRKALAALRISAETPEKVPRMSVKEKKVFVRMFQVFDRLFAQLKSFTKYEDSMLKEYGITEEEYEKYAGVYKNALEEIKLAEGEKDGQEGKPGDEEEMIDLDYELLAYSSTKIDYEYIISLIQNIVASNEEIEEFSKEERQKQIAEVKQYIEEMRKDNWKVAELMTNLIHEIEEDENKYKGQSILHIMENMKRDCIDRIISDFCDTWYASKEDVMYAALHYRNGEIPNESVIKATIDYQSYKSVQEKALPKFKYYAQCMAELKKILEEEIKPLIHAA
ncbi:HsdR family type I site-specific deoxyribonuclease [Lacrimispora saccharolytica]|nr:HsdR family type I site-specific deoxyribonuclease [Lacrimispora saccharolytica]